MNKITNYIRGVFHEGKRIKWPKRKELLPAFITVLVITIFAAIFLLLENYASEVLVKELRQAFESLR
jgi:preprotein translocase SecE subunit